MRPELELIQRIEQYLDGELSAADKAAFESQLPDDAALREALQLQQDIRDGLERASLRSPISRARRNYYRRTWYRWGGSGLGVALVAVLTTLLVTRPDRPFSIVPGMGSMAHGEVYTIDCRHDTILHAAHGAVVRIPGGAIDAGPAGIARLEIKEAYTIAAMIRYGLLTRSNGGPLSSGGMIDIRPAEGSSVRIVRPIHVALPTLRVEENMQCYKGVVDDKGKINWVDPYPLADSSARQSVAHGKTLFETSCRSCHSIRSAGVGPALAYVGQRRPQKWLAAFLRNNAKVLEEDCYARYVYNIFNRTPMDVFPYYSDADITSLLQYIGSESQLIDSNQVPNYTREFDSCRRYQRLAGELAKKREALIRANGLRTQVIRHFDTSAPAGGGATAAGAIDTAARVIPVPAVVIPVDHPSFYYQFTIESFGWYNVDLLLKDLPGILPSELRVQMAPEYSAEVNVFFIIPGRKLFVEGGFLKNSKTEYGFFHEDGHIPLPQGEQAYVFATGEYQRKPVFAIHSFMTALRQTIDLKPQPATKEQITAAINRLDLNQLSVRIADSRNAAQIRAIDTSLAAIQRFKPQHCECDCGLEAPQADSLKYVVK